MHKTQVTNNPKIKNLRQRIGVRKQRLEFKILQPLHIKI